MDENLNSQTHIVVGPKLMLDKWDSWSVLIFEVNGMKEKGKSDVGSEIKEEHFKKGAKDGVKSIQNNEEHVGKDIDREVRKDQKKVQKGIQ
jgi:hypothetical protein